LETRVRFRWLVHWVNWGKSQKKSLVWGKFQDQVSSHCPWSESGDENKGRKKGNSLDGGGGNRRVLMRSAGGILSKRSSLETRGVPGSGGNRNWLLHTVEKTTKKGIWGKGDSVRFVTWHPSRSKQRGGGSVGVCTEKAGPAADKTGQCRFPRRPSQGNRASRGGE